MIGGNPQGLARAERALGLASRAVAFESTFMQYPCDEILFENIHGFFPTERRRWRFLHHALRDFDVIHFNFGQSIAPTLNPDWQPAMLRWRLVRLYQRLCEQRDLPFLKWAGKGIIVTYQGDDARQGDHCRAHFSRSPAHEPDSSYYSAASDEHKRRRIARFARYADRIFALNPDLLHVLPQRAEFLPYAHIDLEDWQVIAPRPSAIPTIAHAPTNRSVKGTRYLLDAVARLQAEKIPFHFKLVEGLSNRWARAVYEACDLLVDQLLVGWYGGLAVECMALGKPVVCYIRETDLQFIPAAMRQKLPIIPATPETIYEVLKNWLTVRKHELPELGLRSRKYVEEWHSPSQVAVRLRSVYEEIMSSKSPARRP